MNERRSRTALSALMQQSAADRRQLMTSCKTNCATVSGSPEALEADFDHRIARDLSGRILLQGPWS